MKIKRRQIVIAHYAPRQPFACLSTGQKRADIVVHPLTGKMHEHRSVKLLKFAQTNHRADHTERVFVGNFNHLRHFLEQNLANNRIILHILPRHHNSITLIENRRLFGGNVINFGVVINFFDSFGFARHNQAHQTFMPSGGGKQSVVRRADAAGIFVIIVGYVNRFEKLILH